MKLQLEHIYDRNPFVKLLQMAIGEINEGAATLVMPVSREVHGNLYGMAHGGALASLADTAMGMSCATHGNRVVTLEMNLNFIAGAAAGQTVYCRAKVIHSGKSTMVAEAELDDGAGKLLAKARGTFFVTGQFSFEQD